MTKKERVIKRKSNKSSDGIYHTSIELKLLSAPDKEQLKQYQDELCEELGKELCGSTLYSLLHQALKLEQMTGKQVWMKDPETGLTWMRTDDSPTGWECHIYEEEE